MLAATLALLIGGAAATVPLGPLDAVAGVYKHRFENGLVDGSSFISEDVLEVVKVSPSAAYVRAELNFYNGHECSVAAVFDLAGPDLVHHDPEAVSPGAPPCTLKLHKVGGELQFDDGDGSCKSYCGARGSWGGEDFKLSARRPIRYLRKLLASSEYREAVAAHAKSAPKP